MARKIAIIGGSGLDDPQLFTSSRDLEVTTKWGDPSCTLREGEIEGTQVVLLARHGRQHTITPSHVNYRANIQALKDAGCTHILASTAVGSLREEIHPGDLVVPDQFIDFTKQRHMTFHDSFAPGEFAHVAMPDPFNEELRQVLIGGIRELGFALHTRGTVVTIEGPRFSTRAESHMFRSWGADIINMSIATEAVLANEAAIPYAVVAMSTDYDCWRVDEAPVTGEEVKKVARENAHKVLALFRHILPKLA